MGRQKKGGNSQEEKGRGEGEIKRFTLLPLSSSFDWRRPSFLPPPPDPLLLCPFPPLFSSSRGRRRSKSGGKGVKRVGGGIARKDFKELAVRARA